MEYKILKAKAGGKFDAVGYRYALHIRGAFENAYFDHVPVRKIFEDFVEQYIGHRYVFVSRDDSKSDILQRQNYDYYTDRTWSNTMVRDYNGSSKYRNVYYFKLDRDEIEAMVMSFKLTEECAGYDEEHKRRYG